VFSGMRELFSDRGIEVGVQILMLIVGIGIFLYHPSIPGYPKA
jgi:hypothetical protein